jgi:hypothetical protein
MSGGFASAPTGNGISGVQTPIIGTNRGSDGSIVDKLNEVINAINNNSLRNQIRTIDAVELAQEVDRGNNKRSVL